MRESEHGYCIETTFQELLAAIDDVAESDDEAFAVLERMLLEGRISLLDGSSSRAAG